MERARQKVSAEVRNDSFPQTCRRGAERRLHFTKRQNDASLSTANQWRPISIESGIPANLNKPLPRLPPSQSDEASAKPRLPFPCIRSSSKSNRAKRSRQDGRGGVQLPWRKRSKIEVKNMFEWRPESPIRYTAVERGSQTDPVIVVEKYPVRESARGAHSMGPNVRPRVLRYLSDTESDKGLGTPLWSPRLDANIRHAQDYFILSGSPDADRLSLKRSNQFQFLPQHGIMKYSGAVEKPSRHLLRHGKETSVDTVGTYESRYSNRGHDDVLASSSVLGSSEILIKEPASHKIESDVQGTQVSKQPILNINSSVETVNIRPRLSKRRFVSQGPEIEASDKMSTESSERRFVSEFNVRRARHNHKQALLQYNRTHQNKSQSSEATQGSSEEIIYPSTPEEDMNFYNVPLEAYPGEMPVGPWHEVPDHFLGSPLCPQHPKHKSGGFGICPMHGRKQTHQLAKVDNTGVGIGSFLPETDAQNTTMGNIKDFNLEIPLHQNGDSTCPAAILQDSGKYGVCPLHGRGKDRDADKLTRLL